MAPAYDYHVHSTYSDGGFLSAMLGAAAAAGLDGVGIADHCNVSERVAMRRARGALGFNLDRTYDRRRQALDRYRERFDLEIFDAVEMDYDPRDEAEIRAFLDEAGFDYALGRVHFLEGVNVHAESYFTDKSEAARRGLVDTYYDRIVALVDSELFEVAAHVDLLERNPALRGYATTDHYERVAAAFADSRTVPEVNAGRVHGTYGEFHPAPDFLDVLFDHGVAVTVGSDAHGPEELRERHGTLVEFVDERGFDPVHVVG